MELTFYGAAIPAVIILGIAKGGFYGVGMVAVPIMALTMSPMEAAAIILPILVVQDIVSVISYRKFWDSWNLRVLLPGAVVGIGCGYQFAAGVSEAGVSLGVGALSLAFGLYRFFAERSRQGTASRRHGPVAGFVCGFASGLASMIVHSGGPPFQMFVLPQKLPRDVFVGTSVVFFAAVNIVKVLPYFMLGQITERNLMISATLFPLAIVSTWAGIWLVRRTSTQRFYTLMYVLMVVIGLKLMLDGANALWIETGA